MAATSDLLQSLESGPSYLFADFPTLGDVVPVGGAGVYTIWDDEGALIYVGVAGRNPEGKGLVSRLRSHANGRRSGDQFCVYVADHYVLPELDWKDVEAIRDSRLSMDALIREKIRTSFAFRFAVVSDYRAALAVERAVKAGQLRAGTPHLNPN